MYQNFIFDLYGTLVDIHTNENTGYFWKKCAALLTEFGCTYDAVELKQAYVALIKEQKQVLSKQYACPEVDLGLVFTGLFERKEFHPDSTFLPFFASTFRVLSRKYLYLYPEIMSILKLLKDNGKNIYLLSNAQTLFTLPEIKELGIYEYFDDILISSDCHCKKPDPAFIELLLHRHKLKISESIMIGNEYESDIAVAKAVKMDSYYIHSNLSTPLPTHMDATYSDITTGYLQTKAIQRLL